MLGRPSISIFDKNMITPRIGKIIICRRESLLLLLRIDELIMLTVCYGRCVNTGHAVLTVLVERPI